MDRFINIKESLAGAKVFLKDGPFLASFSLFSSFLFKYTFGRLNFAGVEIQTADLWCQKQSLYQLSHHHCHPLGKVT